MHAITDGRDTPTQSAPSYISQVEAALSQSGVGHLASLCGRYWAMDRDQRWERIEKAHTLYTDPDIAVDNRTAGQVLAESYAPEITDEFLEPVRLQNSVIKDGDSVLVFNFRLDRARQIVQALCLPDFEGFARSRTPELDVVTFTQVEQDLPVQVVFLLSHSTNCWARWLPMRPEAIPHCRNGKVSPCHLFHERWH